jgi:hypothetical protein
MCELVESKSEIEKGDCMLSIRQGRERRREVEEARVGVQGLGCGRMRE